MYPAVVTAVLLLVGVLNTVTARPDETRISPSMVCKEYPEKPCGDGWSFISDNRCVKYFDSPRTFPDVRYICFTINSTPVSIHSEDELNNLLCVTWRLNPELQPFWIGARKFGPRYIYLDGSPFDFTNWYRDEPDDATGDESCIESNLEDWGLWNNVSCTQRKNFVCAKNV